MAYFEDKPKSKYLACLHYCPHAKCFDESLVYSYRIKHGGFPWKYFSGLHSLERQCKHQISFKTKKKKEKNNLVNKQLSLNFLSEERFETFTAYFTS